MTLLRLIHPACTGLKSSTRGSNLYVRNLINLFQLSCCSHALNYVLPSLNSALGKVKVS